MGCGPCAIINSYLASESSKPLNHLNGKTNLDKVQTLIDDYGSVPSIYYGDAQMAYSPTKGTTDIDLLAMINSLSRDCGLLSLVGEHVMRKSGESQEEFINRIQKCISTSIANGFHPLIIVRPVVAEYNASKKKYLWEGKSGHWVAIHRVGALDQQSSGFSIEYSDSLTGELKTGIAYSEMDRKAVVPLRFTIDEKGKHDWEWVPNTQTLTLFTPNMPLATKEAKWNERSFIAIRYLIYQPVEQ